MRRPRVVVNDVDSNESLSDAEDNPNLKGPKKWESGFAKAQSLTKMPYLDFHTTLAKRRVNNMGFMIGPNAPQRSNSTLVTKDMKMNDTEDWLAGARKAIRRRSREPDSATSVLALMEIISQSSASNLGRGQSFSSAANPKDQKALQ
jgi:hypothetical protein